MLFQRAREASHGHAEREEVAPTSGLGNAELLDTLGGGTPEDAGTPIPHLDAVAASFGDFDVAGVAYHGDEDGVASADAVGAHAFSRGEHVVGDADDLHTSAHEAAHVIQHRAGGPGDESHADAVAAAVVGGRSAVPLLAEVGAPSDGPALEGEASRLKYTDVLGDHAIDIASLSEAQVWDLLQQDPRPGNTYGQKTFEEGDKDALERRYLATFGQTLAGVRDAFRSGPVGQAATRRQVGLAVDEFAALLDAVGRHPKVKNVDAWLYGNGPKMTANAENLLDFVNELREIKRRADALADGQTLDIAEQAIANTDQTADIGVPGGQVEIKTVREPINRPNDLADQLSAGFAKFAGAAGGEVVIYASYADGVVTEPMNRGEKRRSWDKPTGERKTDIYVDGALRNTTSEKVIDYLTTWLGQAGGGRDAVTTLEVRMENGKSFTGTRGLGGWGVA